MFLSSPALAAMWARHDALVARPDKKLPIEAVAFVTSLACADLNSLSANPVGATLEEIAASAAQSRQAAATGSASATGTSSATGLSATSENGDDADDAAKIIRHRSRRASLSFGLQSPEQMRQDALGAGQAQVNGRAGWCSVLHAWMVNGWMGRSSQFGGGGKAGNMFSEKQL